jgi:hypothetical protein
LETISRSSPVVLQPVVREENLTQGGAMSIQAVNANVSSLKSIQSNAAQEATETAAVTKKEAASGDRQAIRKLAAQQQAAPAPATPEGIGKAINVSA